VLVETDYRILPSIALICNLIVVSGGTYRFARAGYIDFKRIFPWVVTSVSAAWLGGYLNISETLFVGLLGISLLLSGARMLYPEKSKSTALSLSTISEYRVLPFLIGIILGLLAGLVGIGGGIFLAPVLYLLRWDNAKKIAATCSVFILVNSLSGLIGQTMKIGNSELLNDLSSYWALFLAVLIGGQIGAYVGVVKLNSSIIRLMTGVLILYVSARLIWRWWGMG
jgi:uncharacterized membrane protein YfcA